MKWTIWFEKPSKRIGMTPAQLLEIQERVEADEAWDSPQGGLRFLNYVPLPEPEKIEECGHSMTASKVCVRALGHSGKHMDKLKPKYVKPKLTPVRGFAAGSWADYELVTD